MTDKKEQTELDEYDLSKYKPTPTDVETDDVITEIHKGKAKDFYTEQYWDATSLTKSQIAEQKEIKAIEIITENGAKLVIILPETEMVHPKSILGKWLKQYQKAPTEGMHIKTLVDKNGFYKVVL